MSTANRAGLAVWGLGCVLLLALVGCGESDDRNIDAQTVIESSQHPEDQVMREAAENRKRFLGDGKARYTPQAVEGF